MSELPPGFVLRRNRQNAELPEGFVLRGQVQPEEKPLGIASAAYSPFKPIVDNTAEAFLNTAAQTGEAISEPMLANPNEPGWIKPIDATVRAIGKAGNALGGTFGALVSPLQGALTASVEPMVRPAAELMQPVVGGNIENVTPEAAHQVAGQLGGDLTNAVMLGVSGNQGRANMRSKAGLPPEKAPYDPLQPVYDKLSDMSAQTGPRRSFMANNSSDPMQAPAVKAPSIEQLKTATKEHYEIMRKTGATLNNNGLSHVAKSMDDALKSSGNMNPRRHGDTLSVIDDFKKDAASGQMDLEKVDQYRQDLLDVIKDNTSKLDGPNSDAGKAQIAITALDDAIESLQPGHASSNAPQAIEALNKGRTLYATKARMQRLQRIEDNAYMTDNPATAIKTGYRNLAKEVNANPRGWTPEEIEAINHAAQTGIVTGALKTMGSRLISGVAGAAGGAAGGGVPGAMLGVAAGEAMAFPLRAGANKLQAARGNAVKNLVGSRPEVQAIINPPPPVPPPTLKQIMKMPPAQARAALQAAMAARATEFEKPKKAR